MNKKDLYLQYTNKCILGNKMWLSPLGFNGLFCMDMNSFDIEYKGKFPSRTIDTVAKHTWGTFSWNNKLFFPVAGEINVDVYDTESGNFSNVEVPVLIDAHKCPYYISVQKQDKLWFFPQEPEQGVSILDMNSLEVKRDSELTELLLNLRKGKVITILGLKEGIISVLLNNDELLEIDIEKKEILYRRVLDLDFEIYTCKCNQSGYWFMQKKSTDIYELDIEKDEFIKYTLIDEEWLKQPGIPYSNIIFCEDYILVTGNRLKNIMQIDKKNRVIKKVVEYPEGFRFIENDFIKWTAFWAWDIVEGKIWLHPMAGNMLLVYDAVNNSIEGHKMAVPIEDVQGLLECIDWAAVKVDDVYSEKDGCPSLKCFINYVANSKDTGTTDK